MSQQISIRIFELMIKHSSNQTEQMQNLEHILVSSRETPIRVATSSMSTLPAWRYDPGHVTTAGVLQFPSQVTCFYNFVCALALVWSCLFFHNFEPQVRSKLNVQRPVPTVTNAGLAVPFDVATNHLNKKVRNQEMIGALMIG